MSEAVTEWSLSVTSISSTGGEDMSLVSLMCWLVAPHRAWTFWWGVFLCALDVFGERVDECIEVFALIFGAVADVTAGDEALVSKTSHFLCGSSEVFRCVCC